MKNFKFSSSANGKVFRNGLYSTAILAAAIVLAVLINLLVGAIPKNTPSSTSLPPKCTRWATTPGS